MAGLWHGSCCLARSLVSLFSILSRLPCQRHALRSACVAKGCRAGSHHHCSSGVMATDDFDPFDTKLPCPMWMLACRNRIYYLGHLLGRCFNTCVRLIGPVRAENAPHNTMLIVALLSLHLNCSVRHSACVSCCQPY